MPIDPNAPIPPAVLTILATLFPELASAEGVLEIVGYPRTRYPDFSQPQNFWRQITQQIRHGILPDGRSNNDLLRAAADMYPGHRGLAEWLAPESRPDQRTLGGGSGILLSTSVNVHELIDLARNLAQARGVPGPVELIFASGQNLALSLPQANAQQSLQLCDALFQALNGRMLRQPTVAAGQIRDYLISRLFVEGPDSARFEFNGVPASTPVREIARALMAEYNDEMWPRDRQGQARNAVVNYVQTNGTSQRLSPDSSLHESEVGEDATLEVHPESTAGAMVDPQVREEALARVRAQVLAYAESHRGFEVDANTTHAPTEYILRFRAQGWGPPRVAGSDPEPVDKHEVYILLSPDFPMLAPLAIWQTDIFHPNVDSESGKVCLGALEDHYRPGIDFGEVCQMLMDIAGYQNYGARDGYYNDEAMRWAKSERGQMLIESRGGQSLSRMLVRMIMQESQVPLPLRIKRLGAHAGVVAEADAPDTAGPLPSEGQQPASGVSPADHPGRSRCES
jgi:hypothetical protein